MTPLPRRPPDAAYAGQQLVEGNSCAAGPILGVADENVVQKPLPCLQEFAGTGVVRQHVGVPYLGEQIGKILG
jgi:hypothetical protein